MHSFHESSAALALCAPDKSEAMSALLSDREVFGLVVRNLRKFAGPHPELEDLVQKALLEAHRALPNFRGECQPSTFIYAICYRVWFNHTRWQTRFLKRFQLTEEGTLPETIDPHDPAEVAVHRQRYAELYRALEKLPPPMRAVVVLHDLDELELEEIASITSTNQHTVRSRLRHGRQRLKSILLKQALRGALP